jgi:hypothetical protein
VFARIAHARIRVTKGKELLTLYGDPGGYCYFCKLCGSTLFATLAEDTIAHVQLGTLIDPPSVMPNAHIFVSRRQAWDVIADGLPQYRQHVHEG